MRAIDQEERVNSMTKQLPTLRLVTEKFCR